jgi:hypothetical protein
MSKDDLSDLSRTARAIEVRDRLVPVLDEKLACEASNAVSLKILAEIEAVEQEVGVAYGEDTKDRNDPRACAELRAGPPVPSPGCELSFVRRMVSLWRERSWR